MAFRSLPLWGKVVVVGGGTSMAGALLGYTFIPFHQEHIRVARYENWTTNRKRDKVVECVERDLWKNESCDSLLKKHMTKDVLNSSKRYATWSGASLYDNIRYGLENPKDALGVILQDYESLKLYSKLYDPLLKELFSLRQPSPNVLQQPGSDLTPDVMNDESVTKAFAGGSDDNGSDIAQRIRNITLECSRSIDGFHLMPTMILDDLYLLECRIKSNLQRVPPQAAIAGTYYRLNSPDSFAALKEAGIASLAPSVDSPYLKAAGALKEFPNGRGVYVNEDKNLSIWINYGDHIKVKSVETDVNNFGKAVERLMLGLQGIEGHRIKYFHHPQYGYVTLDPRKMGTGLTMTVTTDLQQLPDHRNFKKVLDELGLDAVPVTSSKVTADGKKKSSTGGRTYEISNRQTFGLTERQLIKHVCDATKKLIDLDIKGSFE